MCPNVLYVLLFAGRVHVYFHVLLFLDELCRLAIDIITPVEKRSFVPVLEPGLKALHVAAD